MHFGAPACPCLDRGSPLRFADRLTGFPDTSRCRPRRAGEQHEFSVYWLPRRSVACDKVLEDTGLTGDVLAEAFLLDWVPLDKDLLSLELGSAYKARRPRCWHLRSPLGSGFATSSPVILSGAPAHFCRLLDRHKFARVSEICFTAQFVSSSFFLARFLVDSATKRHHLQGPAA